MGAPDLPPSLLTTLREELTKEADAMIQRAAQSWLAQSKPPFLPISNFMAQGCARSGSLETPIIAIN